MLSTNKIFEHLFIIMLGFATYETIYFNKEKQAILDSFYFYTVFPILFCAIFSVLCSGWAASAFRNRLELDKSVEKKKSEKFERNAWFFIVVSIYFEFRVFFMTFNDINQRTALCFAIAFFLAKIAMYAEAHELVKKRLPSDSVAPMIKSLLIASRSEIARRIIRTARVLPGTGRGTMHSMVEGHRRRGARPGAPLHHRLRRWSPSRAGRGF